MPIKIPKKVTKLQLESIDCSLLPIDEYSHIPTENKRYGRYAQSTYTLTNFGKTAYVVVAYLETDFQKYRNLGMKDDEIIKLCIEHLNKSDGQKKKDSKPKYGLLQVYNYNFIKKLGKEIAAIELVTDHRTNENFWGSGAK